MPDRQKQTYKIMPAIHLVYATPKFPTPDDVEISERIVVVEDSLSQDDIAVNWEIQNSEKCIGQIRFKDHDIRVGALPTPLPKAIIDRTIHVSMWQPQIKATLRQHLSHLSLVYVGQNPDPVQRMIALYGTARGFENENLLGIVNEGSWTAHPRADFLSPEKIAGYRDEIPFVLWVGYVKFFVDKQSYWLITKGHHIFDVPDLAYFMQPGDDPDEIMKHFINIFYYIYEEDAEVTPGDTLAISGTNEFMKFSEVKEYEEILMGPSGTLVIEKISPDEVNPPELRH